MSTEIKEAFEVKWRIENLKSWFAMRDDALYSPRFLVETLSNTSWKLCLAANTHCQERFLTFSIKRDVEDDRPEQVFVNYALSFVASDGSLLKHKYCRSIFTPKSVSHELNVKEDEIFREKKESYLPEGALTVCCKLWKVLSSASKGGQCLINSVIGRKFLLLEGTIDYFSRLRNYNAAIANCKSPSSDVSFMSFHVRRTYDPCLHFKVIKAECKYLNFCLCELFVIDGSRRNKIYLDSGEKLATLLSTDEFVIEWPFEDLSDYTKNDSLAFQLKMIVSPGVASESIEYNVNNYHEQTGESGRLENANISNAEQIRSHPIDGLHVSEQEDKEYDAEKNKFDDDECFDAPGNGHLSSTTFKQDMVSMYNDQLFCDTSLRTDSETFAAHRTVLSARSPVFKKMFTTDMKEKAGKEFNITDISSDTVRRMLQFLYTDCTGDLDMQSAKDLYIASDKYDIASLKQRCSSFMKKNFCPANVCEILVLADMHQDKNLESAAQEYVLVNDDEVFYSDEWKLFMKNYGSLAAQVMYLKLTKYDKLVN